MCLAVLEPEQLHQMVSPLLEPVRHPVQHPCRQQLVGTPGRIRERALRGFDRRQRFLGPAHAYEPITAPVAGLTEARCSPESTHSPSIQCPATDVALVVMSLTNFRGRCLH